MKRGQILAILMSSSLLFASAAIAAASPDKPSRKGDHPPKTAKTATAPVAIRHTVKPPSPIVMGRSVSVDRVHHKSKLHHLKVNPGPDDAHGDSQP